MDGIEPAFRRARRDDLPALVRLLADDPLGAKRETPSDPLPPSYGRAFEAIDGDPNQELVVVSLPGREVAGLLQLTFIPYLTYRGSWRAQIEGVRIASDLRSAGLGRRMFEWAIGRARERGCHLLQLTSDKTRPDAIRFYEGLGFVASHEGMKLHLEPTASGPVSGPGNAAPAAP
ncbi:MAG: GNAT family N-acetyltransferase [Burkholderiales bacterium]|nr:MAG: GNAT family N-acetyltransferase [Burkholderiales bacterium]